MQPPDSLTLHFTVTEPVGLCVCRSVNVASTPEANRDIIARRFLCDLPREMKPRFRPGTIYTVVFTPEPGTTVTSAADVKCTPPDETLNAWLAHLFENRMDKLWGEYQIAMRAIPGRDILRGQIARAIEAQFHRAIREHRPGDIKPGMLQCAVVQSVELFERELDEMQVNESIDSPEAMLDLIESELDRMEAFKLLERPDMIAIQLAIPSNNPFLHFVADETWKMAEALLTELMPKMLERVAKHMRAAADQMDEVLKQAATPDIETTVAPSDIMDGGYVDPAKDEPALAAKQPIDGGAPLIDDVVDEAGSNGIVHEVRPTSHPAAPA